MLCVYVHERGSLLNDLSLTFARNVRVYKHNNVLIFIKFLAKAARNASSWASDSGRCGVIFTRGRNSRPPSGSFPPFSSDKHTQPRVVVKGF